MKVPIMSKRDVHVAIVGGGMGGLAAALALFRRWISVAVYEQSSVLKEIGAGLFVYPNSLRQLERLGVGDALARVGAKVGSGSEYYRMDGAVVGKILITDSSGWNGLYGMHRAEHPERARRSPALERHSHWPQMYWIQPGQCWRTAIF